MRCILIYSYASVSLTVNLDALLAGSALAMVASASVKTSQAITPVAQNTAGMGTIRMAVMAI